MMVHRNDIFHIGHMDLGRGRLTVLTETALDNRPASRRTIAIDLPTMVDGQGILAGVSMDGSVELNLPAREGDVKEPHGLR